MKRFCLVLSLIVATGAAAEPVVWLGPNGSNALQLVERAWPADAGQEIGGVKLYVDWLARTPEADLRRMAALVQERQLRVAVEVGGLLNHDWEDQIGERSAETELTKLRRSRDAGDRQSARPLVGAIRWDAWHGRGTAGQAVERTLAPTNYHDRLPFFATVATNGTVRFRNDAPGVMEREIDYARQAGLDFWAFVTYDVQHPGDPMGLGLRQYLASAHAGKPRFCLIVENARWTNLTGYAELVRHEKYLRLADGRPVVFTFLAGDVDEANLRQRLTKFRGLVDPAPFIVGMNFHPPLAARQAKALGLDAISTYAHPGGKPNGAPFAELTRQARRHWDASAKTGWPVVPLVSFGWDGRPRVDNPVPWVKNPTPNYFEAGTPAELADQMRQALDWIRDNPTTSSPGLALIYAWNEFDEGGWLCPILSADGAADTSRIEALGRVLRDHCREPGQTDIPTSAGQGKHKQEKNR
jgi:hypothetical protein